MNKKIKEFNAKVLLLDICNWYGYSVRIGNDSVCCENGDYTFVKPTVEDALIEWKETLIETNSNCLHEGEKAPYIEEVRFIRSLEFDRITNCDLGKMMVEMVNTEEFYEDVCFATINDKHYETIGKNFRKNVDCTYDVYNDFKVANILHEDYVFQNISDYTYGFIKSEVDTKLLVDYYYDDEKNKFIIKKTLEMIETLLSDNGIVFDFYNDEYIVETPKGKSMEIAIDDEDMYVVHFNESTSSHFDSDEGLLNYVKYYLEEDIDDIVLDAEEDCPTPNLLDIRYSVSVKYKEEVNVGLHEINFVPGIPFVNSYNDIKIATGVYVSLDDDGRTHIVSTISDDTGYGLKYWVGARADEVANLIESVMPKKVDNNYIELESGKRIEVSSLTDIKNLGEEHEEEGIVDCKFDDVDLDNLVMEYRNNRSNLISLKNDLEEVFDKVNGNENALKTLLLNDSYLGSWTNSYVYCYETDDVDVALAEFLVDHCNISMNIVSYMNCNDYFHNVVGFELVESDGCIMIFDK